MQQFVFVGSQGSFSVPSGESRIGSDAACQICIRGEGVLPVHAYVRSDGDKLLIRPADGGSSSSGYTGGVITVNGQPLNGPVTLDGGQDIAIGTIQMRLQSNAMKRPSLLRRLWEKTWFKVAVWTFSILTSLLILAYAVLILVILDESALKSQLAKAISTHFLRDDTEIESIQAKPFDGTLAIKNIKVKDRDGYSGSRAPFVLIPSATLKVDMWPWVRSWFRDYKDVEIVLSNPEINLDRAKSDGALNIRDILKKYSQTKTAIDLGITKINATMDIRGGRVRLRDDYTNIGETSLEDINVRLVLPAQGEAVRIEQCDMSVNSIPAPPAKGSLKVTGKVMLVDASCTIDNTQISSNDMRLEMKSFDLARIFEHLGYAWEPAIADFKGKVMLGKPINGHMDLKIQDMNTLRVGGNVASESLLSIREESRAAMGSSPMGMNFDLLLKDNGGGFRPHDMNIRLRSGHDLTKPETTHLNFGAVGKLNPGGTSIYMVDLECILQDFFGTAVGKRLGLQGRLGGRLTGKAKLVRESSGTWKIDVNGALPKEAYVMVSDPQKPTEFSRQPLPLDFEYHASAQPNADGGISELNVDTFHLRAPSFEASSQVPGVVRSINGELETQAQFKLNLKGREFWKEFSPILALFGFTQPIEEILDLKVTLVGKNDLVSVAAVGTASRQWNPNPEIKEIDPAPVQLRTVIDFNRKAAFGKPGASPAPWLSLVLEIISTEGKPMFVHLDALVSRDDKHETISAALSAFDKEKNTQLPGIKSDVVTLRERLQPYIEGYLRRLDAGNKNPNGWLKHYRETTLKGELEHSGKLVVKRPIDPRLALPDVFEFDFSIHGKNLNVSMPLHKPGDDDASTGGIFNWNEQAVDILIKGVYQQRNADNKEDPDIRKLTIEKLDVKGSVGAFEVSARDLDFFKLLNIRKLPNTAWTDCVAGLSMSGSVEPPAYELARAIHLLPVDNPLCGSVALKIDFDRKKDEVNLQKLQFKQTEKKPISFLLNTDATGSVLRVRDLCNRLFPTAEDAAPFTEQLEALLNENGPAALLDHLGDELALNSLQVDTAAFIEWLRVAYPSKPGSRPPPASVAAILNEDWKPEGLWKAAAVRFSRSDPRLRKWTLVGAFRNDLVCYAQKASAPALIVPGQDAKPAARPVSFSFANEWALRMGVAMSQNDGNVLAVDVDEVALDKARITAALPHLKYTYEKPAGEPCKLELAQCLYSHETLAQIGRLKLTGKPVPIDIKDLDASFGRNGTNLQIGEAVINGGPVPCALTALKFDQATDRMQVRLNAPAADIPYLASLFPRVPLTLKLSGSLKNVAVTYKGSIIGLRAVMEPNPVELAKLLKLEKDDPRLTGLNPESDALEFNALCQDTQIVAASGSGEAVDLKLWGQFRLTTRDLAWKDFKALVEHRTPNTSVTQSFASPKLQANSTDAKLTLVGAMRAPGLPVNVSSDLTFSTPLDPAVLLASGDLFSAALTRAAPPKLSDERRLKALENVVFTGSLSAPSIVLSDVTLNSVEATNLSLKGLKLNIPALTTHFYGGKFELADADFDLSKGAAVHTTGRLGVKGVGYRLRLRVLDGDIAQMLGCTTKTGYVVGGKISAQGTLSSGNFSSTDRQTWEGNVKLSITHLSVSAPASIDDATEAAPPWMADFKSLGPAYFRSFMNATSSEAITAAELSQGMPVGESLKGLNVLALGTQAYLGKTFGADFRRLEFETLQPTIEVRSGLATLAAVQFTGRGASAGLDLQLKNLKINLADEAFAEEMILYPSAMPLAARQRLNVDRWPGPEQQEYTTDVETKLALRVHGRPAAPNLKFPWTPLKGLAMRALFGMDRVTDLSSLELARQHTRKTFGAEPADAEIPALLGDRLGVGLPGTLTSRLLGQTLIDRVPGLPPHLLEHLSATGAVISPVDSMNLLLRPEPDPKAPKPPPGQQPK